MALQVASRAPPRAPQLGDEHTSSSQVLDQRFFDFGGQSLFAQRPSHQRYGFACTSLHLFEAEPVRRSSDMQVQLPFGCGSFAHSVIFCP